MAKKPPAPKPATGEITRPQSRRAQFASGIGGILPWVFSGTCGDYPTYRNMRGNPTIALARAAAMAPIKASPWSVEADDGVADDRIEFIQDTMFRLRPTILGDGLRALDYGWQGFEVIWEPDGKYLTIDRLKPLLPDLTEFIVDPQGKPIGLRNQGVDLLGAKAWWYTYDGEAGDPYGRSRNENCRESAYTAWVNTYKQSVSYGLKGATILPMVYYVPGMGTGADGGEDPNFRHAVTMLSELGKAHGVVIPQQIAEQYADLLKNGIDLSQLMEWQVKFFETRAGHGAEYAEMLRRWETLMARAWLVPERAILEGQFGTKAEAGSHFDVGVLVAQETSDDLMMTANCGQNGWNNSLVDRLLTVNFGEEAENTVYAVAAPLVDADKEFYRKIGEMILANPNNMDLFLAFTDVDAFFDRLNWPKSKEIIDVSELPARPDPDAPDVDAIAAEVNGPLTDAGSGDPDIQSKALNGAQISSLLELADKLATKSLPPGAVQQIMAMAFPDIDPAAIARLIAVLKRFKAAKPEPKALPPGRGDRVVPPGVAAALQMVYREPVSRKTRKPKRKR